MTAYDRFRDLALRQGGPAPCDGCPNLLTELEGRERLLESVRAEVGEAAHLDQPMSPAAEWLVDNGYLFEVHIANIRENLPAAYEHVLPASERDRDHPRAYALARELVRHADSQIAGENVAECLQAYQSGQLLTMAELWAFPQMLRLAIIEEVARIAEHVHRSHQLRQFSQFWVNRLSRAARTEDSGRILEQLKRQPYALDPEFVTSLSGQMRDEPTALREFHDYVEAVSGLIVDDMVRNNHQEETATRASIANAVSTLRQLDRLEYQSIFESASSVEQILLTDPSGVHGQSDFATRQRCRHAVEQISRTGPLDEFEVARRVVKVAAEGSQPLERIAAYYLLGGGRSEFEEQCSSRPRYGTRFLRLLRRYATAFYLSSIALLSLSFVTVILLSTSELGMRHPALLAALGVLGAFPLSDLAIQIINALVFRFFPPDELPRLSLRDGIPEDSATLVVVPTMFRDMDSIVRDAANLEVRYLGNRDPRLYFALYPDYQDAPSAEQPEDAALLSRAMDLISDLNFRHGARRFFLFHRERVWSDTQQVWMGKER
jgi:cyclic beta-1,2-glucan synthetase